MCSGCSGRFDDGDDREGERQEVGGISAGLPPTPPPGPLDDYDVWVSAERIVERHVMRAKGPLFNEKQAEQDGRLTSKGRDAVQHSQIKIARYYQEFNVWGLLRSEMHPDASSGVRKSHIWRWLATGGLMAGALWVALR
jgi:hypothetical protein